MIKEEKKSKNNKGITLIALIITIIVLLILAGITIGALTTNNSILKQAGNAKESTEIAKEKEIIQISVTSAIGENKDIKLVDEELQDKLDINSDNQAKIIDSDEERIIIRFTDSGRYYDVAKDGDVLPVEGEIQEKYLTVQCINSKNEVVAEKRYLVLKNTYSQTPPEVEEYEVAENRPIEGTITENKTVKVLYYLKCYDEKTLVFKGLDESGNVTSNESEIVSYMIGNGSGTSGNGMLASAKPIKSVLYVPETYNGKNVTHIGQHAFSSSNIVRAVISDRIKDLGYAAFNGAKLLENIVIGKNVTSWGNNLFYYCSELKSVTYRGNIISMFYYQGCKLTEIKLEGNEDRFSVSDNIVYSKDGKKLIAFPMGRTGSYTVLNTVEELDRNAFRHSQLTSLTISDSVTTIGYSAFAGSKLKNVIIGKNFINKDDNLFNGCSELEEVTFRCTTIVLSGYHFNACGNFTRIKLDGNEDNYMVEDNILYSKSGKTVILFPTGRTGDYTIPNTVETLSTNSFRNNRLSSIVISDNVKTIGYGAFSATRLQTVTIGSGITSIDQTAFGASENLSTVIINAANVASGITSQTSQGKLINYATTIYIKDDITTVGSYVTSNFTETTSDKAGYVKYVKNS